MDTFEEIKIGQLRPHVSVFLYDLRVVGLTPDELMAAMEANIPDTVERAHRTGDRLHRSAPIRRTARGGWTITGHWHAVAKAPSWLARLPGGSEPSQDEGSRPENTDDSNEEEESKLRDVLHHLTLFLVHESRSVAALLATDPSVRRLLGDLLKSMDVPPVQEEELASAFLQGASRQAWLRGIHRPTPIKPDSKNMVGLDLREVIDPFGDQSFRLNAAISDLRSERIVENFRRSLPPGSRLRALDELDAVGRPPRHQSSELVGVSLRNGRVWTGPSESMGDFLRQLNNICNQLEKTWKGAAAKEAGYHQRGYDHLARAQTSHSPAALGDAVDFSLDLTFSEEDGTEELPEDLARANHEWLEKGDFRVKGNEGARLFLTARFDGRDIAELRVQPVLGAQGEAKLEPTVEAYSTAASDLDRERLDHVLRSFHDRAALWFSKGFTIQQGRVFSLQYRDVPFSRWCWMPFDNQSTPARKYDVKVEKPAEYRLWEVVSWSGTSLFEFVLNNVVNLFTPNGDWYLLCDDGSGEIADFVFLDPAVPRLRLVHVKAAANDAPNRQIAPSQYEVVISQATKNLRFLDPRILSERLKMQEETRTAELTWNAGGKLGRRREPIEALEKMGPYVDRGVVVLQPHTTRKAWQDSEEKLRAGKLKEGDTIQLLRLRTMLADLEDVCRRFEASFEAWGENDVSDEREAAFPRSGLR